MVALQIAMDVWNQSNDPQESSTNRLLPHIAEFLEDRLEKERSPAVRCVFGWRLPHLHRLAPTWVSNHLGEILPLDKARQMEWRASWNASVVFNRLYISIWSLLKPYYTLASVQIAQSEGRIKVQGDPAERLAESL